ETEKKRAQDLETLTRVKYQVETMTEAVKRAEATSKQRLAEQDTETEAKKKAEADVEPLKADNAQLLTQLTALRGKFRGTLQATKERVGRMLREGTRTPRPPRPASYTP